MLSVRCSFAAALVPRKGDATDARQKGDATGAQHKGDAMGDQRKGDATCDQHKGDATGDQRVINSTHFRSSNHPYPPGRIGILTYMALWPAHGVVCLWPAYGLLLYPVQRGQIHNNYKILTFVLLKFRKHLIFRFQSGRFGEKQPPEGAPPTSTEVVSGTKGHIYRSYYFL